MEIRYIRQSDDRLQISDIYEKSWKHAYRGMIPDSYLDSIPVGQWAGNLDKEGRYSLVMVEGNRLIGTASFCQSRDEKRPQDGEIISIYLLPEYMGKGYGKNLFEYALEELRKRDYQTIFLWVLESNAGARHFYEKNGFQVNKNRLVENIGGKEVTLVQYERRVN